MQLHKHKYIRQKQARDTVQRRGGLRLEEGFWLEGDAGRRLLRSRKKRIDRLSGRHYHCLPDTGSPYALISRRWKITSPASAAISPAPTGTSSFQGSDHCSVVITGELGA